MSRPARAVVAGVVAAFALVVLLATVVSLLPGHSRAQEKAGYLWTNYGPRLVVASLLAVAVAGLAAPGRRRRVITASVAGLAVLCSGAQVGRVMVAAARAGGSVDPVRALALTSAAVPAPDAWAVYNRVAGRDLRVAIWKPHGTTPAPVMVGIHGGGWIDGPGQAESYGPEAAWWAARGWLFVSVEYRLSTATHASWDESPADVACALSWTAATISRYGGDPDRIVVTGASAGGNLAINLAYGSTASSCPGVVPAPRAVVAVVPVVDPRNAYDHGIPMPGAAPKDFIRNYLGGSPEQHPDRLRAITSATYLSAAAPPTLIIEPSEDGFIPSEAVFAFADAARAAGVDLTVARLPVVDHFPVDFESLSAQANRTIAAAYLRDHVGITGVNES